MKHHFYKRNTKNLTVFFSGWGSEPFEISSENDVLFFYDYSKIDPPDFKNLFSGYEKYYLIAWSLGVFVSWNLKNHLPKFEKKTAINGTLCPIDDKFGIPEKIFDLTLKSAHSDETYKKFVRKMFSDKNDYEKYSQIKTFRNSLSRQIELQNLKDLIKNNSVKYDDFFDEAIICEKDLIFPYKNQINFWSKFLSPKILHSGHFPFYSLSEDDL